MKSLHSAIEKVQTSFPSLYTKEDVISVLTSFSQEMKEELEEELKEGSTQVISRDSREEFVQDIYQELENLGTDIFDDYDLSMSYREVELDDITLNETGIERAIRDVVERYLTKEETN